MEVCSLALSLGTRPTVPLLERVEHLHGTRAAGLISEVPLGQTYAEKLTLRTNGKAIPTYLKAVSPDVHEVFGLRMAAGRSFDADDTPRSQTVVVVNQAFARLYSPDKHDSGNEALWFKQGYPRR